MGRYSCREGQGNLVAYRRFLGRLTIRSIRIAQGFVERRQPLIVSAPSRERTGRRELFGSGHTVTERRYPYMCTGQLPDSRAGESELTTCCNICGRRLEVPADPLSIDCGGHCWGCIGVMEDEWPPSVEHVAEEVRAGLRELDGKAKPPPA